MVPVGDNRKERSAEKCHVLLAARNDNADVVEYLYERNDNLASYKNAENMTSLDVAEYSNSTKCISILGSADIIDPDTGKQMERCKFIIRKFRTF